MKKKLKDWRSKVPEAEVWTAVEDVYGYGDGDMRVSAKYDLFLEEIDEMMLDNGYERCKKCRNWVESGELSDENGELTVCDQCK